MLPPKDEPIEFELTKETKEGIGAILEACDELERAEQAQNN